MMFISSTCLDSHTGSGIGATLRFHQSNLFPFVASSGIGVVCMTSPEPSLLKFFQQEHTPPNFIHQSRSPTIHITKKINTFFPKNISKISKINSRINLFKNILEITVQFHHRLLTNFYYASLLKCVLPNCTF